MGRVISIVGLILIISAGVLTAVSVTYEEQLNAKREIVSKYLKNAEEALKSGDKKEAIKFVKKAIKVDPDSKEPFKFLDKIYQLQQSQQLKKLNLQQQLQLRVNLKNLKLVKRKRRI